MDSESTVNLEKMKEKALREIKKIPSEEDNERSKSNKKEKKHKKKKNRSRSKRRSRSKSSRRNKNSSTESR